MLFNQVADVLRKDTTLGVADKIGEDNDEPETLTLPRLDISEVEEVFGYKWTSLDDTVKAVAASLLDIQKKA